MKEESEYDKQASEFLKKTGTMFQARWLSNDKYFPDDKEKRDIYEIALSRGTRKWIFRFGQSIVHSGKYIVVYLSNDKKYKQGDLLTEEGLKRARSSFQGFGTFYVKNKEFEEPTPYTVFSCLQKYDPGTFEDFCSEYGYNTDSRRAETTYKGVKDEWLNVERLFSDEEIELLQEIQ
jgi:hypothetical protein